MHPGNWTVWSEPVRGDAAATVTGTQRALCPDLLSIRDIGVADGWRGRVVRGFFVVLSKVTGL